MLTHDLDIPTGHRAGAMDVGPRIDEWLNAYAPDANGLLHVFLADVQSGLVIMPTFEGVVSDFLELLNRLTPEALGPSAPANGASRALDRGEYYLHGETHAGPPGHPRFHLTQALLSASVTIPVSNGRMFAHRDQSIFVVDLDEDQPNRILRLTLP